MKIKFFLVCACLIFASGAWAAGFSKGASLAVMDFGIRKGATETTIDISDASLVASTYIMDRLVTTGLFVVMEKDFIQERARELGLKTAGLIDPDSAKSIGKLLKVKYLVYGNVSGVSVSDVSGGVMSLAGGLNVNVCTVKAHIIGRVMDVDTGMIVKAAKGDGHSRSSYTKAGLTTHGILTIGTTKVTQDSVHNALMKAAYAMVDNLAMSMCPSYVQKSKKTKKTND